MSATGLKYAFVIDEEPHFSETVARALRIVGFEVTQCYDATGAWATIQYDQDRASRSLFFIDMALEAGTDTDAFSPGTTDNYMTTGLALARLIVTSGLVDVRLRSNIILYSAHLRGQNWDKIRKFCDVNGSRSWKKDVGADLNEIIELSKGYLE
jgi:hypothetical protein